MPSKCSVPVTSFHDELKAVLPRLRRHGMALTRNYHAMEDLVHDTVVRALAAQHSYRPGTNFSAWIHRILRNEFISSIRSARHVVPLDDLMIKRISVPAAHDERLVVRELIGAIDRLPTAQREALLLSALSELNYDQIAETMACRAGTVKSRIFRARHQLKCDLMGVAVGDGDNMPLDAPIRIDVMYAHTL